MAAEVRKAREDSRGWIKVVWVGKRRDNHYLDCELRIEVAAVISGCLKAGQSTPHRQEGAGPSTVGSRVWRSP